MLLLLTVMVALSEDLHARSIVLVAARPRTADPAQICSEWMVRSPSASIAIASMHRWIDESRLWGSKGCSHARSGNAEGRSREAPDDMRIYTSVFPWRTWIFHFCALAGHVALNLRQENNDCRRLAAQKPLAYHQNGSRNWASQHSPVLKIRMLKATELKAKEDRFLIN